jgi:enoyl-CoA hydratase
LSFELKDNVALLTLDDGKANAINPVFIEAMTAALDHAEREAGALVIAGRPGKFCAGFDLKYMQTLPPEDAPKLVSTGGKMFQRIFASKLPIVAACTGHAIAGGALLLLACDTRIGPLGDFKFGLNETSINMALPVFGIELAKARLDETHLTRSVLQSHIYDSAGAVEAGYLDQIIEQEQVIETALAQAKALSTLPAAPYAATKLALRREYLDTIEKSWAS